MVADEKQFENYTYCEGRTGGGQSVEFTCNPKDEETVIASLGLIRSIDGRTSKRVNMSHGCYGRYSRYEITQHDYAGGGPSDSGGWGYSEVLTIAHPPEGRIGIVIHEEGSHLQDGAAFSEWETLAFARKAFKKHKFSNDTREKLPKVPGFIRYVLCGPITPWFYAVGDEQLYGDYTVPCGIEDDPVYRLGQQFVVEDENGVPDIKTCMGSRYFEYESDYSSLFFQRKPEKVRGRIVYWSDGTCWRDGLDNRGTAPRPLHESELWIAEAMKQFRKLLGGKQTSFTIKFTDDTHFVGKVEPAANTNITAEGDYFVKITTEKGDSAEGWVHDFKPSAEYPDVVQYVTKRYAKNGKIVKTLEVTERQIEEDGQAWSGVFFRPPT